MINVPVKSSRIKIKKTTPVVSFETGTKSGNDERPPPTAPLAPALKKPVGGASSVLSTKLVNRFAALGISDEDDEESFVSFDSLPLDIDSDIIASACHIIGSASSALLADCSFVSSKFPIFVSRTSARHWCPYDNEVFVQYQPI